MIKLFFKSILIFVVFVSLLCLTKHFFPFEVTRVSGFSMFPTLNSGDNLVIQRSFFSIVPGDIITVIQPHREYRLVKRVVAIGGQTVEIRNGDLVIDEEVVEESDRILFRFAPSTNMQSVKLKDNELFILGDFRINSLDSQEFGPIKSIYVEGKVIYKWTGALTP